ncbi:MAG: Rab family GTPase [Promethearchaeota archaeon]|jgi:small GTP-binding protein
MNDIGRKFRFKVSVIGDGRVGKTTLIRRFTQSSFKKEYIKTIGAQFSTHKEEIDGDTIGLLFYDIAGQRNFDFARPSFFKNSRAAIIVYSLEKTKLGEQSFNHILDWYKDLTKYCGNIPVVIFANKVDLVDENSLDNTRIEELVKENKFLGYYMTSAKTGKGVMEAFEAIIEVLYRKFKSLSADL